MGENDPVSNPYAPPDPTRPQPDPVPRVRPDGSSPVPQAPPPSPPDPVEAAKAAASARTTLLLLIAGVLVTVLPSPWDLSAIGFGLVAVVVGARTVVRAWRAHAGTPLVVLAAMLTLSALLGVAMGTLSITLMPAKSTYEQCQQAALTQSAQDVCTAQYKKQIANLQLRPTAG